MNRGKRLKSYQIRECIFFIPYNRFFDHFNYIKEDDIWYLFNIKNIIYKRTGKFDIWTKRNCAVFRGIINKPNAKKIVYLTLTNLKKDDEDKKKAFLAQ